MASREKRYSIIVVGDGSVGKTALLLAYLDGKFDETYIPTIIEFRDTICKYKNKEYHLFLKDTAGQDEYDELRTMNYPQSDCVILCFSLLRQDSLNNVKHKWIQEIRKYLPDTPVILVGTKSDRRNIMNLENSNRDFVSTERGQEVKQTIKARKYIECSALNSTNINEVFEACIDAIESGPEEENSTFSGFLKKFGCMS